MAVGGCDMPGAGHCWVLLQLNQGIKPSPASLSQISTEPVMRDTPSSISSCPQSRMSELRTGLWMPSNNSRVESVLHLHTGRQQPVAQGRRQATEVFNHDEGHLFDFRLNFPRQIYWECWPEKCGCSPVAPGILPAVACDLGKGRYGDGLQPPPNGARPRIRSHKQPGHSGPIRCVLDPSIASLFLSPAHLPSRSCPFAFPLLILVGVIPSSHLTHSRLI